MKANELKTTFKPINNKPINKDEMGKLWGGACDPNLVQKCDKIKLLGEAAV